MKYFGMFEGIGGFSYGIKKVYPDAECVGVSEINPYASAIYKYNYPNHKNYGDATTIDYTQFRGIDILCAGFPCQAFSIAGKREGFNDTRGTLFFEIARFCKEARPRFLLLENVEGLISHDNRRTLATIYSVLSALDYEVQSVVLNSKFFGVPQNRERIFFICNLRGERRPEVLSIGENYKETDGIQGQSTNTLKARYEGIGDGSYIIEGEQYAQKAGAIRGRGEENEQQLELRKDDVTNSLTSVQKDNVVCLDTSMMRKEGKAREYDDYSPALNTAQGGGLTPKVIVPANTKKGYDEATKGDSINLSNPNSKTRRGRVGKGVAQTLDTSCNQAIVDKAIRKLTPTECERLQGFPDGWTAIGTFNRVDKSISDSQRYKACGNAVTTNVITALIKIFPI